MRQNPKSGFVSRKVFAWQHFTCCCQCWAEGAWSLWAKHCSTCWPDTEGFGHPCHHVDKVTENSLAVQPCRQANRGGLTAWLCFKGDSLGRELELLLELWCRALPHLCWWHLWLCRERWMWPANLVCPYGAWRNRVLNPLPWVSSAVLSSCLGICPGPLLCGFSLVFETLSTCAIEHVHVAYTDGKLWVRKTSLCSKKNEFYYGITVANFLLLKTF